MLQISEIIKVIENNLHQPGIPHQPAGLYDPVRYMFSIGGKRIRPALALLGANLFTDDLSGCIQPALAMEMFHNFTLMHDDIMDHAPMRRGMPSVHEKWDLNTAILSGDVMLVKAYSMLCTMKNENLPAVLELFNDTAAKVCEGQQMDIDFETRDDVTVETYISMITYKTAVLLGCSLYCGAIAGGASKHAAALLYDAGLNAGISFQIKDDILDAYGDEKTFGKTIGGDIIQNKKTYLLLRTIQKADDEDRDIVKDLIAKKPVDSSQKVKTITGLYEKYTVKADAEAEMKRYFQHALGLFDKVDVAAERKQVLTDYFNAVYSRNF